MVYHVAINSENTILVVAGSALEDWVKDRAHQIWKELNCPVGIRVETLESDIRPEVGMKVTIYYSVTIP